LAIIWVPMRIWASPARKDPRSASASLVVVVSASILMVLTPGRCLRTLLPRAACPRRTASWGRRRRTADLRNSHSCHSGGTASCGAAVVAQAHLALVAAHDLAAGPALHVVGEPGLLRKSIAWSPVRPCETGRRAWTRQQRHLARASHLAHVYQLDVGHRRLSMRPGSSASRRPGPGALYRLEGRVALPSTSTARPSSCAPRPRRGRDNAESIALVGRLVLLVDGDDAKVAD